MDIKLAHHFNNVLLWANSGPLLYAYCVKRIEA